MGFLEILLSSISISQVQEVPIDGIKGSFSVSGEPVKKGEGDWASSPTGVIYF